YQFHVLYLNSFNERVLRPATRDPHVREDIDVLLAGDNTLRQYSARLIDALARQAYTEAGDLAEAGGPSVVATDRVPAVAMLQADALYHAAAQALADERGVPEDQKATHRQRRETLAQKAGQALRRGLNAEPNHVGLLFLLANSFSRRADWEAADGGDRDR